MMSSEWFLSSSFCDMTSHFWMRPIVESNWEAHTSTSTRVYKSQDHSQSHGHIIYIYLLDFWILRDRIVSYHIIPWFHVFPCNFIISYHFISFLWVSYVFSFFFPMFFLWFCIISIDPTIPIIFTSLRSWSIRISHLIPGGLPGSRRSCGISNTSQIRNKWKRIFLPQWLSDLGDLSET